MGESSPGTLVYVDQSEVRAGKLEELRAAAGDLAEFVRANEPQILSYSIYFSRDGSRMTVVHAHRDAASLDFHMEVAGPKFAPFASMLKLLRIDVYGTPSETALRQLHGKAEMLGGAVVEVHDMQAGFARAPALAD